MLDRPIRWKGEAVYLWELKQQYLQSAASSPVLSHYGNANRPNDGARMVYIVCCGPSFSAQMEELADPGSLV